MVKKHVLALLLFNLVFYNCAVILDDDLSSDNIYSMHSKGTEFYKKNDFENAEKFWILALNKGCGYSAVCLGMLYLTKKVDLNLAKNYFLSAVEKKMGTGEEDLKGLALSGLSLLYVKQDNLKEAKKYAWKSIKNRCDEGYYILGIIYYKEKDIEKAKYYLSIAANQENEEAKRMLDIISK